MLELIYAYLVALGPYFVVALLLGVAIPAVFALAKPTDWLLAVAILSLSLVSIGDGGGGAEGSLLRQIGWGAVFLWALAMALRSEGGGFNVDAGLVPMTYALLVGFACVSVAWSDHGLVSAKRAVQLIGILLIAAALVRNGIRGFALGAFARPGLFMLLLGVMALAVPSVSFGTDGNYKGFTSTKNVWGQFALLMAIVYLYFAVDSRRKKDWWLFGFASLSLLATFSATTVAIYLAVLSIIVLWVGGRERPRLLAAAVIAVLMLFIALSFGYFVVEGRLPVDAVLEGGLASVGKDTTLTGRTALWNMVTNEIARHPWFGTGYGGFWLGFEGPSFTIVNYFAWRPGQAHNGYLDVTNEVGFAGLALLILVLIQHATRTWHLFRAGEEQLAVFHFAILVAAVLLNVAESSFLRTTHLWWVIVSVSIFDVHARCRRREGTVRPALVAGGQS